MDALVGAAAERRAAGTVVRGGMLHRPDVPPVAVGSSAWWAWLDSATPATVRVEDTDPPFGLRRERRGAGRFWYGFRRGGGVLHKVYLGVGAGLTADRLHAAASQLGRLAGADGSRVTRGAAVTEVRRLLRTHRLVTLVGPGGIGKSSLSAEVAGPGWRVELAALTDGLVGDGRADGGGPGWVGPAGDGRADGGGPGWGERVLAEAVRAGLGCPHQPGRTAVETVAAELGATPRLLVLDNCEHLVDAAAALVTELLAACPGLRVLATSRVRLGHPAEAPWPVPAMTVPTMTGPAADTTAAAVLATESGRLFRARAQTADPAFTVTDANAPAVARICRAVDGIPLALELAASRLRVLSVDDLAVRLDDVLLGDGSGTMRAAISWSHDQLDEPGRALFARLSVFAGPWQADSAESVCDATLDGLADLVDRCLLAPGVGRFRFLEPLRQYAAEQLRLRGEEDEVRARHAAWMIELSGRPGAAGWDRLPPVVQRMMHEQDDHWAAWRWLLRRGDLAGVARIAGVLPMCWLRTIGSAEARRRLAEVLRHVQESDALPAAPLAGVLVAAANLAANDADVQAGLPIAERALAVSRLAGDRFFEAQALFLLACLRWFRRDTDLAWSFAVEGAAVADAAGLRGVGASSLAIQALVEVATARPARETADRAITWAVEADSPGGVALGAAARALVALLDGDLDRGREVAAHGIATGEAAIAGRCMCQVVACWIELADAQPDAARVLAVDALEAALRWMGPARCFQPLEAIALVAAADRDWVRSLRLAGAAEALRESHGYPAASYERMLLDAAATRATAALGPTAARAATAEGRRIPLATAVREALHPTDPLPSPTPLPPLTPRQAEVARLVASGMSNTEVAAALHLAPGTVARHLASAYLAVGVGSRTQLAAWVSSRTPVPAGARAAP